VFLAYIFKHSDRNDFLDQKKQVYRLRYIQIGSCWLLAGLKWPAWVTKPKASNSGKQFSPVQYTVKNAMPVTHLFKNLRIDLPHAQINIIVTAHWQCNDGNVSPVA